MNLLTALLIIVNNTGAPMRITSLQSKCGDVVVPHGAPVHIAPGKQVEFKVRKVIHTYEICGSGYCSGSALGFQTNYQGDYTVNVRLADGVYIDGQQTPDHWVGNKECGKR